jgi:transposase InsO family protein
MCNKIERTKVVPVASYSFEPEPCRRHGAFRQLIGKDVSEQRLIWQNCVKKGLKAKNSIDRDGIAGKISCVRNFVSKLTKLIKNHCVRLLVPYKPEPVMKAIDYVSRKQLSCVSVCYITPLTLSSYKFKKIMSRRVARSVDPSDTEPTVIENRDKLLAKYFDGGKNGNSMSVEEFISRHDEMCKRQNITDLGEKAKSLLSYTTGGVYEHLITFPTDNVDPYGALLKELRNSYGITFENAVERLRSRKLGRDETVHNFTKDLRAYMEAICPEGDGPTKSEMLASIFFWPGLRQTDTIKNLCGQWFALPRNERSLERAAEMTRHAAQSNESEHAFVANANKIEKSYGKYGKPYGQGYKNNYFQNKQWKKPSRNCYKCGGQGHDSKNCTTPDSRSVRKVCKNFPLIFENELHLKCLLDTGCSRTICYSLGLEYTSLSVKKLEAPYSVRGINNEVQVVTLCVEKLTICGIELYNVPLIRGELIANNKRIDVLVGLDWLKEFGPIVIGMNETGEPYWTPVQTALTALPSNKNTEYVSTETQTIENPEEEDEIETRDITKTLRFKDFIVKRIRLTDGTQHWEFRWTWIDGIPPSPYRAPANYGLDKYPISSQEGFKKECQLWIDEGFVVPVDSRLVKATIPLMCIEQLQKPSTPIRPVGDYTKLNSYLVSYPHEDEKFPMSANLMLLVWRSMQAPLEDLLLVDIRKAYMMIRAADEISYYQCIQMPWKEHQMFRMTRLGFGINIAVKCLRVIIESILDEEGLSNQIVPYVDDMICPRGLVPKLENALAKNGFAIKPPEKLVESKALGLQLDSQGIWKRRALFPTLEVKTRRGLHQFCGKVIAHYPTAGWIRPACAALKRLTCLSERGGKTPSWDDPVTPFIEEAIKKFFEDLQKYGDSVKGTWQFNKNEKWSLYTDASKYALGAVLLIGDVVVQDGTWLRKVRDRRQINVAELEAFIKGITQIVCKAKRALRIHDRLDIDVYIDNTSVVSWLKRKEERHWTTSKGDTAEAIEGRLQNLEDTLQAAKISTNVNYVTSEKNLADPLSRIPKYLIPPKNLDIESLQEKDEGIGLLVRLSKLKKDPEGRLILDPADSRIEYLMKELHNHGSANSLFELMRQIISVRELRKLCRDFVSRCTHCSLSKVTKNAAVEIASDKQTSQHVADPADRPWRVVHMDVAGPYRKTKYGEKYFICTLVDRYSGYVLTSCVNYEPSTMTVVALFRRVLNVFNSSPEIVFTDNGTIFMSEDWFSHLDKVNCRSARSPVGASWCNGQVERIHRVFHEHLLARDDPIMTLADFTDSVNSIVHQYNTTISRRRGLSPHQLVFSYEPWIYPHLPLHLRPVSLQSQQEQPTERDNTIGNIPKKRQPREGETWLVRRSAVGEQGLNKMSRPFLPAQVRKVISKTCYMMEFPNNKSKMIHINHMKKVSQNLEEEVVQLPEEGGM